MVKRPALTQVSVGSPPCVCVWGGGGGGGVIRKKIGRGYAAGTLNTPPPPNSYNFQIDKLYLFI